MTFSPQQERALTAASNWLRSGNAPVFRLFGYAGTGKTTLATTLAQGVAGRVHFAAYTGKAASVMRQRGCPDATTIHRLIYKPAGKSSKTLLALEDSLAKLLKAHPEGEPETPQITQLRRLIKDEGERVSRPSFILNPESPLHYCSLIIIDEASMVDEQMGHDLLSFGKPVLVLGDPAQLPPVRGEGFFTGSNSTPDVVLTEIHRQAKDNPIIRLATSVREGSSLNVGTYGNSSVLERGAFTRALAKDADQVIVGRNATRKDFNRNYRTNILGFKTPLPCVGDKLVCLRNNHDLGLLNGGMYTAREVAAVEAGTVDLLIENEDGQLPVTAHKGHFDGTEIPWWDKKEAEEFDYGYALTCHKSQGSQWGKVLVFDESFSFREHAQKWLYTAITRASESVTVIKT